MKIMNFCAVIALSSFFLMISYADVKVDIDIHPFQVGCKSKKTGEIRYVYYGAVTGTGPTVDFTGRCRELGEDFVPHIN